METIKYSQVDIVKDGVYLDFDNGPVFLLQDNPENIMLVASDNSYRGECKNLFTLLSQHNNIDVAKTLSGKKITF